MKRSGRLSRMAMAAMMALAMVLVWPTADKGSASPYDHGVQSVLQRHHAHAAQNSRHRVLHVNLNADCDASASGWCVITPFPGIFFEPHGMPIAATDDETTEASAVRGFGREPGVILPPPRRLLV